MINTDQHNKNALPRLVGETSWAPPAPPHIAPCTGLSHRERSEWLIPWKKPCGLWLSRCPWVKPWNQKGTCMDMCIYIIDLHLYIHTHISNWYVLEKRTHTYHSKKPLKLHTKISYRSYRSEFPAGGAWCQKKSNSLASETCEPFPRTRNN